MSDAVDRHAEGQELPGGVGEGLAKLSRDVQDDRDGVRRFLDDTLDRQRMEAVAARAPSDRLHVCRDCHNRKR